MAYVAYSWMKPKQVSSQQGKITKSDLLDENGKIKQEYLGGGSSQGQGSAASAAGISSDGSVGIRTNGKYKWFRLGGNWIDEMNYSIDASSIQRIDIDFAPDTETVYTSNIDPSTGMVLFPSRIGKTLKNMEEKNLMGTDPETGKECLYIDGDEDAIGFTVYVLYTDVEKDSWELYIFAEIEPSNVDITPMGDVNIVGSRINIESTDRKNMVEIGENAINGEQPVFDGISIKSPLIYLEYVHIDEKGNPSLNDMQIAGFPKTDLPECLFSLMTSGKQGEDGSDNRLITIIRQGNIDIQDSTGDNSAAATSISDIEEFVSEYGEDCVICPAFAHVDEVPNWFSDVKCIFLAGDDGTVYRIPVENGHPDISGKEAWGEMVGNNLICHQNPNVFLSYYNYNPDGLYDPYDGEVNATDIIRVVNWMKCNQKGPWGETSDSAII